MHAMITQLSRELGFEGKAILALLAGYFVYQIVYCRESQPRRNDAEKEVLRKRIASAAKARCVPPTQTKKKIYERAGRGKLTKRVSEQGKNSGERQKSGPRKATAAEEPSDNSKPGRNDEETEVLRERIMKAVKARHGLSDRTKKTSCQRAKSTQRTDKAGTKEDEKQEQNCPRKATLAEETKDREEKLSRKQFGFSIYGNPDYCQGCEASTEPTLLTTSWSNSTFGSGIHKVAAVSNLPGSHQALRELEKLRTEFEPIVKARGWSVLKLTEMCCCGDGDEQLPGRSAHQPKGDRVLGFCVSSNDNRGALGIHIRLRPPGSCTRGLRLYPYKELVKTMVCCIEQLRFVFAHQLVQCHELAHIVVGPHNAHFFKVMAELEEEREKLLDCPNFPGFGRQLGST